MQGDAGGFRLVVIVGEVQNGMNEQWIVDLSWMLIDHSRWSMLSIQCVQAIDSRACYEDDLVGDGIVGHVGDIGIDWWQRDLSFDLPLKIGNGEYGRGLMSDPVEIRLDWINDKNRWLN